MLQALEWYLPASHGGDHYGRYPRCSPWGGDLTLKQFLLTGAVACGGLTEEQGNVWGGRSREGLSAAPTSLPFCTVQWETEDSRVKECSGDCEATGGKSLVLICLYFLLPKSILSGNKLN